MQKRKMRRTNPSVYSTEILILRESCIKYPYAQLFKRQVQLSFSLNET